MTLETQIMALAAIAAICGALFYYRGNASLWRWIGDAIGAASLFAILFMLLWLAPVVTP